MTETSVSSPTQTSNEAIRQRFSLVERAAGMQGVITLGRGDPDLPTPAHIVEAAKDAIRRGVDECTPAAGSSRLRGQIAAKLATENHVDVDSVDGVVVTTGGQEGLYLVIRAALQPGDEILVPDPRYTSYDLAIEHAGARMVLVPTNESDGFDLHPDEVERLITERTKALLLISPGNPTAGTITPPHIRRLAEIAQERDLLVVSDEIYEKLLYDGAEHLSIGSLRPAKHRTVTINGFSKTYCMTGWRLGYVAGPTSIMSAVAQRKELWSGPPPAVSQIAASAALTGPTDILDEYLAIYRRRRRIVLDALNRMGFSYGEPRGAFYVYLNASSVGLASYQISELLLEEAHVLLLPGTAFGDRWSNYMRLAYLAPEEQIGEAMGRMEETLRPHLKPGR